MSLKKLTKLFLSLSALALLAGCSAHVDGSPLSDALGKAIPETPSPGEAQPTAPVTNCQNYAGTYQMNQDYFRLEQTDCSKINWVWLPTYSQPNEVRYTYLTDGQPHDIGGGKIRTASFNGNGLFTIAMPASPNGDKIVSVYSFKKTPCDLANPDGSDYLTDDVTVNGTAAPGSCQFWTKH